MKDAPGSDAAAAAVAVAKVVVVGDNEDVTTAVGEVDTLTSGVLLDKPTTVKWTEMRITAATITHRPATMKPLLGDCGSGLPPPGRYGEICKRASPGPPRLA